MRKSFLFLFLTISSIFAMGQQQSKGAHTELSLDSLTQSRKDSLISNYHIRHLDLGQAAVSNSMDKMAVNALGGSATGILGRISGVSFQSGGLVSFRGLSPRYSTVTIDGLSAPVTQQNVKAFALGMLPGTAVQELDVYKSGTYSGHGEWGGANVNISTNANINKNFNSFAFGTGGQQHITFGNFIQEKAYGGGADFFGYGAGKRDFTQDIASREELQAMSRNEAAQQGALMQNTWSLEQRTAMPNLRLDYTMGRILYEEGYRKLSTINSVNFSRVQKGQDSHRAKYTGYERDAAGEVVGSSMDSYMTDAKYSTKADLSINSGWNFQINKHHFLNLNLSYAHSGDNAVMTRYFVGMNNNKEVFYSQFGMTEKDVILGRLTGGHELTDKSRLDWTLGVANSSRNEPDLRRTAHQRNLNDPEAPFYLVIPESSKADTGARFSSSLNDMFYSGRVDFTHSFIEDAFDFKAGALWESNDRTFDARIITTAKDDFTDPNLRFVEPKDLGTVFNPENYGPNGYYLVDGTTDYDSYIASSRLFAGYMGIDNNFDNGIKTSLGVRVENYNQKLLSGDVDVDNTQTDVLPYINLAYSWNPKSSLKLAYSTSVNRPTFRELSPFSFYDFDYRADIAGNPDLENATLYNIDLNYLYTFGRSEYFSVGAFYKKINNPIEMVYVMRSDMALFSFDNAESAQVGGMEMEFSKFLSNNEESFFYNWLLNGNMALTKSKIELGEDTREISSDRPLQGQTPFLASLGSTYVFAKDRAQATLSYAYRGKSLYSVGDGQETYPWYLAQMNHLNLGFAYTFKNNIKVKFFATNLLNTPAQLIEDANMNGSIKDDVDNLVSHSENYQSYNITISYKF